MNVLFVSCQMGSEMISVLVYTNTEM